MKLRKRARVQLTSELQSWPSMKGTFDWRLKGSPTCKLQETNRLTNFLYIHISSVISSVDLYCGSLPSLLWISSVISSMDLYCGLFFTVLWTLIFRGSLLWSLPWISTVDSSLLWTLFYCGLFSSVDSFLLWTLLFCGSLMGTLSFGSPWEQRISWLSQVSREGLH